MKTIYNSKSKEECVSLDALENSSTLFSFGAPDPWAAIGYVFAGHFYEGNHPQSRWRENKQ